MVRVGADQVWPWPERPAEASGCGGRSAGRSEHRGVEPEREAQSRVTGVAASPTRRCPMVAEDRRCRLDRPAKGATASLLAMGRTGRGSLAIVLTALLLASACSVRGGGGTAGGSPLFCDLMRDARRTAVRSAAIVGRVTTDNFGAKRHDVVKVFDELVRTYQRAAPLAPAKAKRPLRSVIESTRDVRDILAESPDRATYERKLQDHLDDFGRRAADAEAFKAILKDDCDVTMPNTRSTACRWRWSLAPSTAPIGGRGRRGRGPRPRSPASRWRCRGTRSGRGRSSRGRGRR